MESHGGNVSAVTLEGALAAPKYGYVALKAVKQLVETGYFPACTVKKFVIPLFIR
jgi:hypothetical protein